MEPDEVGDKLNTGISKLLEAPLQPIYAIQNRIDAEVDNDLDRFTRHADRFMMKLREHAPDTIQAARGVINTIKDALVPVRTDMFPYFNRIEL